MELEVKLLLIAAWLTSAYQQNICNICSRFWSPWLKSPLAGPGVSGAARAPRGLAIEQNLIQ